MLYESDINSLVSQWEERADLIDYPPQYKEALQECAYELKSLLDKTFNDEALAQEAFEVQAKENEKYWNEYFNNLVSDGIFAG